MMSDK